MTPSQQPLLRFSPSFFIALCFIMLFPAGSMKAQGVLADSAAEFSGIQGQDDWWHGYRNLTLDGGENDYDPEADFIPFPVDGSTILSATNFWNGNIFDWHNDPPNAGGNAHNPPWTSLGATNSHPNGSNQAETHWTVRRWTAPAIDLAGPALLQIDWSLAKSNTNGTGVSAQLHLNGAMAGKATIAGNDTAGVSRTSFLTVEAGDHVDLVHTAEGPGGNTTDGSDSSTFSMVISTLVDDDNDQLADSWEDLWFPGDLTQLATGNDYDGDTVPDEEEFTNGTDPTNADTDGDGYPDAEELAAGSSAINPSLLPAGSGLADSREGFSGIQDQEGWSFGYRNYSQDGGGDDYDATGDFIPFPPDAWRGDQNQWRLAPSAAPWTTLAVENTHPNGTNSAPNEEHWTVRRWTAAGLDGPTDIRVYWMHRAQNLSGDGTTGAIYLNGEQLDSIAVSDATSDIRSYYLNIDNGDIIDQVVTPVGTSGNRSDGSDGSTNWMRIDTRIPTVPVQPDGSFFVRLNAPDVDGDSIPDFIEEDLFNGDLTQLTAEGDWDGDGATDVAEIEAGSDPTIGDSDNDGLLDGEELITHGTDPTLVDSDGDNLTDYDEVNGDPATDPTSADSDGDGFNDDEELEIGSDPTSAGDTPLSGTLGDSVFEFSNIQGQDGWESGYRNVTLDGGGIDYDAADFIPFPEEAWRGTQWRLAPSAAPWTLLAAENSHPNGTNSAPNEEHWTVRRWAAADLTETTAVRISWSTRKVNANGDGVTGAVHLNGKRIDSAVVSDLVGVSRVVYANISNGDFLDLVLTPQGRTSDIDGSDGSANSMRIDTRIPASPIQPDGSVFIPANAPDTDGDGIPDLWEELFFPGDLDQLSAGGDYDSDGVDDEVEILSGTNPVEADTDGDGLSDGEELASGTNPLLVDSDGDAFGDFHEVATGFDPLDNFSNVADNFTAIADSEFEFPFSDNPQGEYGWTYGYYDVTADGEPPANSNFIPFPTDGSIFPNAGNFWDGLGFDWYDDAGAAVNPPWTEIGQLRGHPNGDNNDAVHWAVRRWEVSEDTQLALHYFVQKVNAGGNGVTAILLHNGRQVHSTTIAGDDTTGRKGWFFVEARAGDYLAVALSPRGPDGSDNDGNDGSNFWLIVDPTIPDNPLQPDGSPFVPGGQNPEESRLTAFSYDGNSVTLRWTSQPGKDYQVQQSSDLQNWTNIGATVPGAAGETEISINEAPVPSSYYRLLEIDP